MQISFFTRSVGECMCQFELQLVRSLDNRDTFTNVFRLICVTHARPRVGAVTCV